MMMCQLLCQAEKWAETAGSGGVGPFGHAAQRGRLMKADRKAPDVVHEGGNALREIRVMSPVQPAPYERRQKAFPLAHVSLNTSLSRRQS